MTRSLFSKWGNRVFLVLFTLGLAGCSGDFKFTGTSPVDFGDVLVFTSSAPATLTWQNAGTAHEVIGGRAETDPPFGLVGQFTAATIATNGTVSLQCAFTPQAVGAATGEAKLQVIRTVPRAKSEKVGLKGKGVFYISDGNITISETIGGGAPAQALDFGKVPVGTSKTLTISVKNATPAAVATTVNWSRNNQGFSSAPANGAALPIPANTAATVTITFTPTAVGVYQDSVAFKDATGKIVSGIMVKGEGVKPE
jgi:hypothetical protein